MEASSPLLAVVEHWVDGNVLNLGLLACWRHVCPTSACTCGAAFVLIEFLSRVCSCRRRPSIMAHKHANSACSPCAASCLSLCVVQLAAHLQRPFGSHSCPKQALL